MKKSFVILLSILFGISIPLLLAPSTENGVDIITLPVMSSDLGQVVYYTIPSGTGDCSSWTTACSFRSAVAKCPGTKLCLVYVGAGLHDLNNGSDANGTTIDKDYVTLQGVGTADTIGQPSQLMNSRAAGVDYILRVTGNRFMAEGIVFDNTAQTDKNITMLNIRGSYSTVKDCLFRQNVGDGGGTGILADNGGASLTIDHCRFRRVVDYGMNIGNFTRVYIEDGTRFLTCGTGLYLSNANAGTIVTDHTEFYGNTTAMNLVAGQANTDYFVHTTFANNTTNFTDATAYAGGIWVEDVIESGIHRNTYPTGAGVVVQKDANAYTWGLYNDIIPAGTLKKPFKLERINMQDWNAEQVYKIEFFYGTASPGTTSLGVYEIYGGDPLAKKKNSTDFIMNVYVPAYATVGAKLMSSTAGVDSITISLGYELL